LLICALPLPVLQAQNLPALEVIPPNLPSNGTVTLRLEPGTSLPGKRVTVAVYESNRSATGAAPAAQVWKVFEQREGRWQANVTVEADPGSYEFRLLTADKTARPLTTPSARLEVPGVAREAGWWLPGGLPFLFLPPANEISTSNTPPFVPNLQRDATRKTPTGRTVFAGGTPAWRTLSLPSLREMMVPNYDWVALKSDLTRRLNEAQGRGERGFWGWSLPSGTGNTPLFGASAAISQLRGLLKEASPGAALILEVDATQNIVQAARDVDSAAAFCDTVLLRVPNNDSAFWAVKTARRVAEEQFSYDLPILLRFDNSPSLTTLRTYLLTGATGFVFDNEVKADTRQFMDEIARDASLWIGSVTLEDTGILPPPDAPDALDDEALLAFVSQLRAMGRIPLLARATSSSTPESLMLRLGNHISGATIDRLERLARAGARVYIEGTPTLDETGKAVPWRMATLVGADVTAMPPKRTALILDDPWVFGTGRGTRLNIEQNFAITLKPPLLSAQAKTEKGVLTQVGPRTVATLEDGSPGVIINVIGKGEVIWLPHRLMSGEPPKVVTGGALPTVVAPASQAKEVDAPWQKYLTGITDYVAPRLVQQRAKDDVARPFPSSPVLLRRSAKGALLLWMNRAKQGAAPASITVEGARSAALELNGQEPILTTTRGFQTTFTLDKASDALLALGNTRQELDAERNAPRAKVKLR
jgi:hypothetical protein